MLMTRHRIQNMCLERPYWANGRILGANCGQITPGVAVHSGSASSAGYTGRKTPLDCFHGMEEVIEQNQHGKSMT
jgi:hypothetical protein